MKSKLRYLKLISIFFVLLVNCGGDDSPLVVEPNTLRAICGKYSIAHLRESTFNLPAFPNTTLINVPEYAFGEDSMRADGIYEEEFNKVLNASSCCIPVNFLDQVSTTPTLKWEISNDSLVAAAIFKGRVHFDLHGTRITNSNDIVWAWHNKLKNSISRIGNIAIVNFNDGRKVMEGEINEDSIPSSLDPNTGYTWIVWAWNNEGTKIIKSSREIFFFTKGPEPLEMLYKISTDLLHAKWVIDDDNSQPNELGLREIEFRTDSCKFVLHRDRTVYKSTWQYSSTVDPMEGNLVTTEFFQLRNINISCKAFEALLEIPNSSGVTTTTKIMFRRTKEG